MSFDPSDVALVLSKLGGFPVDQMTGIDFDTQQNASFNEGPGGVIYGFNTQKRANGVSVSFSVRQTSPHIRRLMEICRDQKETALTLDVVRNLDEYAADEPIGFSCPRAIIMMQGLGFGRGEAADVGFTAMCIGYSFKYRDPNGTQPKLVEQA